MKIRLTKIKYYIVLRYETMKNNTKVTLSVHNVCLLQIYLCMLSWMIVRLCYIYQEETQSVLLIEYSGVIFFSYNAYQIIIFIEIYSCLIILFCFI